MGRPYSQDLRDRVLAAMDEDGEAYELAPLFRVSVSYIYKVLGRRRATGETTARRSGGGPKPKLLAHDAALRERIAAVPDSTLVELQAWLLAERGVKVSIGCLSNRLRRLGLPRKKSRRARPSRTGPTSPRRALDGGAINPT
jgi:transposase